ncbi:MAG: glycosyltransferase WbuB, partial [Rhodospirillales bacterium]|nr:glycosyltransferase WbuB [Rhodospirillales bacterium]
MRILFLADNFPPETNAAATRVYERACYWASWGHDVTVITCAPNFPRGKLLDGYDNCWHQVETISGIRIVRVKTFITKNEGVVLRSLDFLSFFITGTLSALAERRPDVVVATSPQFFVAVAGWIIGAIRKIPFVFELGDLWPASISAVGAIHQNIALRWLERFELFLYQQSACIISLTHSFKMNLVSRGTSGDKIAVIIN